MRPLLYLLGALAMSEAAEFSYVSMEGYGGEVMRLEVSMTSQQTLLNRREAHIPGGSIGRYEFQAPNGSFEKLAGLTGALAASVSPMRPDTPAAFIRLRDRRWSAPRPSPAWDAHGPLRTEVLRLAGEAEKHPLRAILVRMTQNTANEITVELSNPGSQPVELDWKKVRVKAEGFIAMSKLPPDPTGQGPAPLPPANMTVGQYQPGSDAPPRIEPRGKITLRVPLKFPKPGAWKLQARYECLSLPDGSKGIEGNANSGTPVAAAR